MGEKFQTKKKISMNSSEEINFQNYVESVKQKKIPWNIFEDFMKDLAYSNSQRLKLLNAILLIELTTDYSDLDRLKYLNSLLLTEFKEFIEREDNFPYIENENFEESRVILSDSADEIIKEESETEIIQILEDADEVKEYVYKRSINDNGNSNQMKPNAKHFSCQFCNKQYSINFHLKQHIKKVHEQKNKFANKMSAVDQDLYDEIIKEITNDQTSTKNEDKISKDFDSSHDEEEKYDTC